MKMQIYRNVAITSNKILLTVNRLIVHGTTNMNMRKKRLGVYFNDGQTVSTFESNDIARLSGPYRENLAALIKKTCTNFFREAEKLLQEQKVEKLKDPCPVCLGLLWNSYNSDDVCAQHQAIYSDYVATTKEKPVPIRDYFNRDVVKPEYLDN